MRIYQSALHALNRPLLSLLNDTSMANSHPDSEKIKRAQTLHLRKSLMALVQEESGSIL